MIDRTHRFHGYGSLRYVYRNGQTLRGNQLTVKYILNPKRKSYRLSVVVSRKVNKSAVVRNRIRRRLYEFVRIRAETIKEPYDIVLSVFSDQLSDMAQNELETTLLSVFNQAHILTGSTTKQPRVIVNKKEM